MVSYWRKQAKPIIERVLRETAGQSVKEIRKALSDAYPFGPKEYHPYKIWLDEIKAQRGLKQAKDKPQRPRKPAEPPDPRQTTLFV